jgi:hypothetical protein
MAATASFPIPGSVPLDNAHIEVAPTANCTGSTSNVTAAPGYVCIYPDILVNANSVSANTGVTGTRTLGLPDGVECHNGKLTVLGSRRVGLHRSLTDRRTTL